MRPTELAFSVPGNDEAAAIRNRLAALRAEQTALERRGFAESARIVPTVKDRRCDADTGDRPNQAFIPVTAEVIDRHLRGRGADGRDFTIGVYPMLADEACWFLAIDFDKKTWASSCAAATSVIAVVRSQRPSKAS